MKTRRLIVVAVVVSAMLLSSHRARAQFSQQGPKLVGAGAVGGAAQGAAVSVSADGNTAIVGGFGDNINTGAAWVWTRSGGVWTQQGPKLIGSGAVGAALQGGSVSLSADGNTAIVGGYGDSNNAGAAWIWIRSGGVWTQQGSKLVGSGAVGSAYQGSPVSISADGNTAIVGGPNDNGSAGATWVWTRSGGVWTQQGPKLVGSGAMGSATLGSTQGAALSLSSDGNTAIIGRYFDNQGVGAAWVWTRSGGIWTQQGPKLVGSGAVGSAFQGGSVSLSADGDTAIVGGHGDDDNRGASWVWTRTAGVWSQQGPKLIGSGALPFTGASTTIYSNQGASVSLSADGNTAITSGPSDNNNVGGVWFWTRTAGVWTQEGDKLLGSGTLGAAQGASVSLSGDGNTAVVGGPVNQEGPLENAGAAWVFAAADLTIAKSHAGNFQQGDTGDTYAITVTNSGSAATSGTVTVTDNLPTGMTPTGPIGTTSGWTCSIAGQALTCTRSDVLAAGGSYPAIPLTVNVLNSAGANVTNLATVSGGGEVNTANDTASDPTTVSGIADVAITKLLNGGPPFPAGGNVSYTITASNNGPGTASSVVVTDILPLGTTLVSATPSQGSCSGTTTVSCAVGELLIGSNATIALVLTTGSTPGAVSNTATVSATQTDPNPANNSSTSTVNTIDPILIPVASGWALMVLAGMLAMIGAIRIRG